MTFFTFMFAVWAFIFILALAMEVNTVQQIGTSAMMGSIAATIVHIFKYEEVWPEFITFTIVWVISWIILFAIFGKLRKNLHDSEDGYLDFTNKEYIATKGNEDGFGTISINDKVIRFKSIDKIKKGDKVFAESLKGVTLTVVALKKKEGK